MQIIIPMSGYGERFRKAGYMVPKPLIDIEGKPVIAHVINMFPGETDFLFVCNREHLEEPSYRMREILEHYCPTGVIKGIAPHKLGPVHAVAEVFDLVDPRKPTIINYCDFTCYWDWEYFRRFVAETACDGALPAYRGFHPHSLGTTNYAHLRERDGWVSDIREKQPWTANRMAEYASSGTYYFRTGEIMRTALKAQMARELTVDGEYYVSLSYKPMLDAGQKVAVYDIQHFMQWGAPEDVAEYRVWSDTFRHLVAPHKPSPKVPGITLVPMAGAGSRFVSEGYEQPKPLISVSGSPMAVQAVHDLPSSEHYVFVLRQDLPRLDEITSILQKTWPGCDTVTLSKLTDGQARTAMLGLEATSMLPDGPLTIAACDNGSLYNTDRLIRIFSDPDVDVVMWVIRGHANATRYPHMYSWVGCDGTRVTRVSVKEPLGQPSTDPIVIGTFTFRHVEDFKRSVERMVARDARVNGEFYIDMCINDAIALGLECHVFEIDSYLCWGTPDDLRTFEYWQSCFHKWEAHPYRLENDKRIPANSLAKLVERCRATVPQIPVSWLNSRSRPSA